MSNRSLGGVQAAHSPSLAALGGAQLADDVNSTGVFTRYTRFTPPLPPPPCVPLTPTPPVCERGFGGNSNASA